MNACHKVFILNEQVGRVTHSVGVHCLLLGVFLPLEFQGLSLHHTPSRAWEEDLWVGDWFGKWSQSRSEEREQRGRRKSRCRNIIESITVVSNWAAPSRIFWEYLQNAPCTYWSLASFFTGQELPLGVSCRSVPWTKSEDESNCW